MQPLKTASTFCHPTAGGDRQRRNGLQAGRQPKRISSSLALIWVLAAGCTSTPIDKNQLASETASRRLDPAAVQLIGDLTRIWGMQPQRVDGVSLVVGLPGTGSDPPPTIEREMLLAEMQRQEVDNPNSVLASPTTALVQVSGLIPPGAKQGDRFDIDVVAPRDSGTTNLAGGWLMESRLREYASINGRVAEGHVLALAQGDVLVRALLDEAVDDVSKTRGAVLGGGVVLKSRGFGLIVREDYASVQTSSRIGEAINARFDVYRQGRKRGVAEPKRDSYIELLVHPTYKDNVVRYMRVIQNIAIRESGAQRSTRLSHLRTLLAQPSTAALAAIKLEALGADGIPALKESIDSSDAEIRFYAAEALAYQNEPDAVPVLGEAAAREPAFRYRALAALGAMDSVAAHEQLVDLMNESSAETRYGAFRVLRNQTPFDPVLGGQVVADRFAIHQVNSAGPPLIHVSRQDRAEIVFFGSEHCFAEPLVLFVGKDIVVRGAEPGRATVRRLTSDEDDEQRTISTKVVDVLTTAVELGASYSEVVQALTESKRSGTLPSRLEFSAIPTTGRVFSRGRTERSNDAPLHSADPEVEIEEPADGLAPADTMDWLDTDPQRPPATEPITDSREDTLAEPRAAQKPDNLLPEHFNVPTTYPAGASMPPNHDVGAATVMVPAGGDQRRESLSGAAQGDGGAAGIETNIAAGGVPAAMSTNSSTSLVVHRGTMSQVAPATPPTAVPITVPAAVSAATPAPISAATPAGLSIDTLPQAVPPMAAATPQPPATAPVNAYWPPGGESAATAAPVPVDEPKALSQVQPPSNPKSPMPPAPERVLSGVDLLDLIEAPAPRRRPY